MAVSARSLHLRAWNCQRVRHRLRMRLGRERERLIVVVQFGRENLQRSTRRGFLLLDDLVRRFENFVAIGGTNVFTEFNFPSNDRVGDGWVERFIKRYT